MSDARAIAAVTATLQAIVNAALLDADVATALGSSVKVTALPPDRVPTGDAEVAQLNLFLHDVTPKAGWRNTNVRSHDGDGNRVANPALALDLHYLLSAYGAKQLDIELLLGHALQALHEQPVLAPETIAAALPPALAGCGALGRVPSARRNAAPGARSSSSRCGPLGGSRAAGGAARIRARSSPDHSRSDSPSGRSCPPRPRPLLNASQRMRDRRVQDRGGQAGRAGAPCARCSTPETHRDLGNSQAIRHFVESDRE